MTQPATEDEIRRLYQATIDELYAFVASRCRGDLDLAEDVTQETWLRAVRSWHAKGIPDRPAAWLTTVARNLLSTHFRRRPFESLDGHDTATPNDRRGEERASLVHRALAQLPVARHRLLTAFHLDRHSIAEIAATQGLSERAVEGRLRRAREQLRDQIKADPDSEGEL